MYKTVKIVADKAPTRYLGYDYAIKELLLAYIHKYTITQQWIK